MEPIDVVLIDLPRVLSDTLKAILEREPDIRVRGQYASDGRCLPVLPEDRSLDVAIVGSDRGELPEPCRRLLVERASAKVLTVAADGREAFVYELRPHRSPLGELSQATLIEAIRSARA